MRGTRRITGEKLIGVLLIVTALVATGVAYGANKAWRMNMRTYDSQALRTHAEVTIGAGGQVSSFAGVEATKAARTTTGLYTISFDPTGYASGLGTQVTLLNNSAIGYTIQVKSVTPSTGIVILNTATNGATASLNKKSLPSGAVIELEQWWNLSAINP